MKKNISIRIEDDLNKQIEKVAKEEQRTKSQTINLLLKKVLKGKNEKE